MKLLEEDEINALDDELVDIDEWINETDEYKSLWFSRRFYAKAQAKKIIIELQAIYKLPDLKMEHDRMGEFIQSLQEEIE